jgi:hypothetical protein
MYVFADCSSLSSICIPSAVGRFAPYCFQNCSSLTTVTFESRSKLTRVGDGAFHACSPLLSVFICRRVQQILGKDERHSYVIVLDEDD